MSVYAARRFPSVLDKSAWDRMNFTRIEVLCQPRENPEGYWTQCDGHDLFRGCQPWSDGTDSKIRKTARSVWDGLRRVSAGGLCDDSELDVAMVAAILRPDGVFGKHPVCGARLLVSADPPYGGVMAPSRSDSYRRR